jgi:nucleoside-diphosphate-sugar epimerase
MKILVLGGTQMLGRDFVERYKSKYSILLANRGVTLPGLFPDLDQVRIDRNLPNMIFPSAPVDAVVDFSCYSVNHLENTTPALPPHRRYVYVSTRSVFDSNALSKGDVSDVYYRYCVNKVLCEDWIRKYPDNGKWSVVRPCAVVGRHDYTRRFIERDGKYFWKCNGQPAGVGTIPVQEVSSALEHEILQSGFREVSLCG